MKQVDPLAKECELARAKFDAARRSLDRKAANGAALRLVRAWAALSKQQKKVRRLT